MFYRCGLLLLNLDTTDQSQIDYRREGDYEVASGTSRLRELLDYRRVFPTSGRNDIEVR